MKSKKGIQKGNSTVNQLIAGLTASVLVLGDPCIALALHMSGGPLSAPTTELEISSGPRFLSQAPIETPIEAKVIFEAISDVIINAGNTVLLELKAHSNVNKEITFNAVGLPEEAKLMGNKFQWNAGPSISGEHKLVFKATDGSSEAEQTVSFYFVPTPGGNAPSQTRPMILPDNRPDSESGGSKNVVIVIPTSSSGSESSGATTPLKDTKSKKNLDDSEFRAGLEGEATNGGNVVLAPGTSAYGFGEPGLFFPDSPDNSSGNNNSDSGDGSGDDGSNNSGNDDDDGGDNPPDQPPTGDTTAPIFIDSSPARGSEINSLTQIVFTFSDNVGLDENGTANSLNVTRDSVAFSGYTVNTGTANQITLNISSNSTARHIYRFRITPIDEAGNQGTQADVTITDLADVENDTTAPTFADSDPDDGSEVNSLAQIRFTFSDNNDIDENATANTLSVTRDDVAFSGYSKNSSVANQVTATITNIPTDRHVYRFLIRPIDVSGNNGAQVDITITDLADVHNTFQDRTSLIQPAYVFGRGIAFMDYNNDNFEDLYIVNPFRQDGDNFGLPTSYKGENLLLRQQGDGTFVDQGSPFADNAWMPGYSGITPNASSQPQSISSADIDNDGFRDFFITNSAGENVLKRSVSDASGFLQLDDENNQITGGAAVGDSRGAIFADFNADGYVDIFVANGVNNNVLYVNQRGNASAPNPNSFTNMAQAAGIEAIGKNCLSAIAFDADNDGDSDLYLLYLHAPNELYVNDTTDFAPGGAPHFTLASGVMNHSGHSTTAQAGDLDNDGYLDILVCDLEGNSRLYRNTTLTPDNPSFLDVTTETAVNTILAATQSTNTRVNGAAFIDFDNDSDLDIFLLRANDHNVLLKNPLDPPVAVSVVLGDQVFIDATSSELVALPNLSESVATSDFNNDGRTDLFISAFPGALSESILYQNVSQNPNHFLKVKLQQSPLPGQTTPQDSTGALVVLVARGETGSPYQGNVVTQTKQLLGGSGRSQDSPILHFGITDAIQPGEMVNAELDLTVFWPNDDRVTFLSSTLGHFAIDNTIIVTEDVPSPFFVGITESGVDRDAAINAEFFYILQVDDPDVAVDEQSLVVTVANSGGTSINNSNLTPLTGEQLGKWLFRFNANEPAFSVGQTAAIDFRVTNPTTHRFSTATLRVHIVSQSDANAVPVIDGIPGSEVVLDLAGANSEMTVELIVTDPDQILAANPPLAMSIGLALQNGNPRPGTSQIELLGSGNVILSNDGKQLIQSIRWQPDPADLVLGLETTGAVYAVSVTVDDFVTGDVRTPFTETFNVRVLDSSVSNYVPFVWNESEFLAAVSAQTPLSMAENDVLDVDLNPFLTTGRDPVNYSVTVKSGSPVPVNAPSISSNHVLLTPHLNDGNQTFTFELTVTDNLTTVVSEFSATVVQVPAPTALIVSPENNSTVNTSDVLVTFDTPNWTVGGKGETHIHFHLDGVPGYTSADHFMFYNGTDHVVEFNTTPGQTPFASWATPTSLYFHDVPDGIHQLRAHLADASHNALPNSEASMTITFTVAAGPFWNEDQPVDRTAIVGQRLEINLADAITNPDLHALNFSLRGVEKTIDNEVFDVTPLFIDLELIDTNGLFSYTPAADILNQGSAFTFFFGVEDTINPVNVSSGTVITIQHELVWNMPAPQSTDVQFLYFIQLNYGEEITYSGNPADLVLTLTGSSANDPNTYFLDQATNTLYYRPDPDDYFANRDNGTPVTFNFNVTDGSVSQSATLTISQITDTAEKYGNVFETRDRFTFDENQIFARGVGMDPLPGLENVEKWKLEFHSNGNSIDNGAGQGLVGAVGDVTGKFLVFDIRVAQVGTGIPIIVGLKDRNNVEFTVNIETHPSAFIEDIVTSEPLTTLQSDKYVRVKINTAAFTNVTLDNLDNWTIRISDRGEGQTFTIYLDNMRFE